MDSELISADIQTLVGRLAQTMSRIGPEDLTELAQMHGWSHSLADTASATDASSTCVCGHAQELTRQLEQLIVGDCADVAQSFLSIREQIKDLAGACHLEVAQAPAEPPGASASSGTSSGSVDFEDGDEFLAMSQSVVDSVVNSAPPPTGEASYEQVPLVIGPKETEYIKGFVEEGGEHIQAIEAALLDVERSPEDSKKVDDLFRPFHTVKGLAGFLNLRDVNCLTHEAETLLDQARKGTRQITAATIDLIFDVVDILKAQIGAIATHMVNPHGEVIPQPPIRDMIRNLRAVIAGRTTPEDLQSPPAGPDSRIGEVLIAQKAVAREVVEFALQEQQSVAPHQPTGELLVKMQATSARQIDQALRTQKSSELPAGSPAPAAPSASTGAHMDFSVRIDTAKLDALVDMVGELVIAHTLVEGNSSMVDNARLTRDVSQVGKIVRDIQELAMSMRMVPIGPTFQKMERLVRDLSRKATKRIELVVSGQETELDKNVIQQISDPLVHMVRNSVDHGIETAEERTASGKTPVGQIRLAAFHRGGHIVIEIQDDGKGLDAEKLASKAIEKGLIAPNTELTEQEAYALIFAPGFSMAATITDISGRGVGMDVVKRNIEQLRGKIEIQSRKGEGTTFSILLPLTLAIIDGMVVRVGAERFIIPTTHIEQALRPTSGQITSIHRRGEVLQTRGRLLPIVQLGELFRLSRRVDPCQSMVVIVQSDHEAVGIVVDELIGQQQVVIKSLGSQFERLRGISGAAILGDGRVGLILEVSGLRAEHQVDKERDHAECA